MIPELLLIKIINSVLQVISKDARINIGTPQKSMLFKVLKKTEIVILDRVNLLEQALIIFSRKKSDNRYFNFDLSFNPKPERPLSMFLSLGNEQYADNSIGNDPDEIDEEEEDFSVINKRVFSQTHNLYIYSDSYIELLAAYHVIKLSLISVLDYLAIEGFRNITISGQDVAPHDLIPKTFAYRVIVIKYQYEVSVPSVFRQAFLKNLYIESNPKDDGEASES